MQLQPDLYVVGNVVSRSRLPSGEPKFPLMEAILESGAPYTSGPQWLSEHVLQGRHVLAVAGTHGKTSTTSMLAWILEAAGLEPGFLVGGVPLNFGVSARLGKVAAGHARNYFVIEADEYDTAFFDKRSKFVHYRPRTAILNNLEFDHADIFEDLPAIERQFHHLVRTVPGHGRLVVNGLETSLTRVLAQGCWSEVRSFGAAVSDFFLLLSSYQSAIKMEDNVTMSNGFYSWFKNGPFLYKSLQTRPGTSVSFIDNRTGEILTKTNMADSARSWSSFPDMPGRYVDWKIVVKEGCHIIYQSTMDLFGQHVLIRNAELSDIEMLANFQKSTGCIIATDNEIQLSPEFFILGNGNSDDFYRILSMDQIRDFYTEKKKIDKKILVEFATNALGDNIAFVPYVDEFAKSIGEKVYVYCLHSDLFGSNYTNIEFVERGSPSNIYTDYISIGYLFDMPLQKGMAYQLGLDYKEIRPVIKNPTGSHKLVKGKYVCFSMHSTTQAKHWNNNNSWSKLCDELIKIGITPVCIDRYASFGTEGNWNPIPSNCINRTGGDLNEMSLLIRDSEFFIGLSSGLSWLAHGLGKKVVVISGVTSPDNEFSIDCLRIHRNDVCNSCFSKTNDYVFNSGDWLWCPEHKGTSRQFECTKKISAKQVMDALKNKGWI
jgi:autotransporter strand-loop-strand O-heptosyltransferase